MANKVVYDAVLVILQFRLLLLLHVVEGLCAAHFLQACGHLPIDQQRERLQNRFFGTGKGGGEGNFVGL